ncbi:MAG: element excision factor XisI family protein [Microcystaceae cyanobacterium]
MDKIEQYRIFIQDLLSNYSQYDPVEVQLIFDTTRDHYQWMNVGWDGLNRVC